MIGIWVVCLSMVAVLMVLGLIIWLSLDLSG